MARRQKRTGLDGESSREMNRQASTLTDCGNKSLQKEAGLIGKMNFYRGGKDMAQKTCDEDDADTSIWSPSLSTRLEYLVSCHSRNCALVRHPCNASTLNRRCICAPGRSDSTSKESR